MSGCNTKTLRPIKLPRSQKLDMAGSKREKDPGFERSIGNLLDSTAAMKHANKNLTACPIRAENMSPNRTQASKCHPRNGKQSNRLGSCQPACSPRKTRPSNAAAMMSMLVRAATSPGAAPRMTARMAPYLTVSVETENQRVETYCQEGLIYVSMKTTLSAMKLKHSQKLRSEAAST